MLSADNTKVANAKFSSHEVHTGFKVFRHIPCIVSDLPMPKLFDTLQLGMLDHFKNCISNFMKRHEQLDQYNAICLSVPTDHDLTRKNMSYEEVSEWNQKEMKEMSRYLLGVVTQSV
jgi:hypothetical protein